MPGRYIMAVLFTRLAGAPQRARRNLLDVEPRVPRRLPATANTLRRRPVS